jgi:hypothetical protein
MNGSGVLAILTGWSLLVEQAVDSRATTAFVMRPSRFDSQRPAHATRQTMVATPTQHRADLLERFNQQLLLAPLTRGGNLPFRRLCAV